MRFNELNYIFNNIDIPLFKAALICRISTLEEIIKILLDVIGETATVVLNSLCSLSPEQQKLIFLDDYVPSKKDALNSSSKIVKDSFLEKKNWALK